MRQNSQKDPKAQSLADHSENSRNSKHGYLDNGNYAEVQFEARAKRTDDNGSHH